MSQLKKNKTDVFLSVFGGQVWTVENAAKTLVWTKNFLSVFKKQKTEVFESALVWTGPLIGNSLAPPLIVDQNRGPCSPHAKIFKKEKQVHPHSEWLYSSQPPQWSEREKRGTGRGETLGMRLE